ncbi:hypothetical protein ACQW5G_00675 [Fructilactobacillus sp. Tb1]|uniref:hypothetical protein n=1 Tax=Fructilactobacillus sp. Tb1 TaxID=3422304 RepID=UPI003D2A2EF5
MSDVAMNWFVLVLIILVGLATPDFIDKADKYLVNKRIKQNKQRGNHFKEMR